MERKSVERELKQRIQTGKIRREDVTRRLAELAFGKANDCVRLALEDEPRLDKLDLSLLSEVKRNDKGEWAGGGLNLVTTRGRWRSSSLTGYRRWNSWRRWRTGSRRTWTIS